jgi:hypothetical protein
MKISSSFLQRLLCFVAICTSSWPTACGQEEQQDHTIKSTDWKKYVRGAVGAVTKYSTQNEINGGTNVRDVSAQQNKMDTIHPPVLAKSEWTNEVDLQVNAVSEILRQQAEQDENRLCAWGLHALGGTLTYTSEANIAFPSLDSNYWVTPILVKDLATSTIKITGKAPTARYYSFQTYVLEDKFSSTVGALKDVDIIFGDDEFTIFVTNGEHASGADQTKMNSLRGLPPGVNDGIIVLMYRTYEPKPFKSPAGGVHLPLISIERLGGKLRELAYCDDPEPIIEVEEPIEYKTKVQFPQLPPNPVWFRTVGSITPFPNEDVAYLATDSGIFPVMGYVVVVRGKAPTFPNGVEEDPQVRFWSLCKLSIPSTKTVACLQDEEVTLDSEGRYVIVVAPERPSGTGFDYLNFGPGPLGSLAFRHMLPSDSFFPRSVHNIQNGDDESQIRRKMGEFYPDIVYCPKKTIEKQGVEACF